MEFQPISSAPTEDEERILLFFQESALGENISIEGWWFSSPKEIDDGWETVAGFIGDPTHWAELPEVPL